MSLPGKPSLIPTDKVFPSARSESSLSFSFVSLNTACDILICATFTVSSYIYCSPPSAGLAPRRLAISTCWMTLVRGLGLVLDSLWICLCFMWVTDSAVGYCFPGPVHIHLQAQSSEARESWGLGFSGHKMARSFPFWVKIINSGQVLPDIFIHQSSRQSNSCYIALRCLHMEFLHFTWTYAGDIHSPK